MYLKQLEAFLAVAETGSFVRAAEQLYLTQPAVTQQIQSLEHELGFALLQRSKRRVELTPEGSCFLNGARQIVDIYRNTVKECVRMAESAPDCTIHYIGYINLHHIPSILKEFHERFPSCRVATRHLRIDRHAGPLLDDSVRLLLTPEELLEGQKGIVFQPLYRAGYYAVMSAEHPLAQFSRLAVEQLAGCGFLTPSAESPIRHIKAVYRDLEAALPGFHKTDVMGVDDAFAQLLCSQSIAIMPEYNCPRHPDLVSVPLSLNRSVTYGVAYTPPLTPMEEKLVEQLCSSFQRLE